MPSEGKEVACTGCGKTIPSDSPESLCPSCLLRAGLDESSPDLAAAVAAADVPSADEVAAQLPQFQIVQQLGRGGMGVVFRARQPHLERDVAVKVLATSLARDPSFTERFIREAKALAQLNHPNIVAVYEFGQTAAGPLHYMVMEYVDGTTLRHLLRQGLLPPEQALTIVPQICLALQYAHEQGIVHRDIKPENVLIDRRGRVKIADFGLAKLIRGERERDVMMTQVSQRMGTPVYMAPEQIETPLLVDHRADIYSLGVVFYEMLTGELPMGRFDPPSHRAAIDVRLDDVVLKSLEKKREQRYQHASEISDDVETITTSSQVLRRFAGSRWSSALILLFIVLLLSLLPLWSGLTIGPIRAVEPIAIAGVRYPRVTAASAWYPAAVLLCVLALGAFTLRVRAPRGAWAIPAFMLCALAVAMFAPYRAGAMLYHGKVDRFLGRFEFLPNGSVVMATRGPTGAVIVDPLSGRITQRIPTRWPASDRIAVSPDGSRLLLREFEKERFELIELPSARSIAVLQLPARTDPRPKFSPDSSQLVVAANDAFDDESRKWVMTDKAGLYFYSSNDGRILVHDLLDHPSLGFEPLDWRGHLITVVNVEDNDGWFVRFFDSADHTTKKRQGIPNVAFAAALAPDLSDLMVGARGQTYLLALPQVEIEATLDDFLPQQDRVQSMNFTSDSRHLAIAHYFGHVDVWDMTTRSMVWQTQVPGAGKGCEIVSVRFNPSGKQLIVATAAGDYWVYLSP